VRVLINGRLIEESEARISAFDRGFLFGDGVFESMRAVGGVVFRIDRHLARLQRSASLVAIDADDLAGDALPLRRQVEELLRVNRLRDARVRVSLTRGPGRPGDYLHAPGPPTILISAAPFRGLDPALRSRGVKIAVATRQGVPGRTLDPAIKTISRLHMVLARREAAARGAHEAVFLDADGNLTEGTASNLFLVCGGVIRTAPVPSGALPGITREAILELARREAMTVSEATMPLSALTDADEAFLSNTSWEVLPVIAVDDRAIDGGRPGPVSRRLGELYARLLRDECGDG